MKYRSNYIYAKNKINLFIFCLFMSNYSLLFCNFYKYFIIQNTYKIVRHV